MYVVVTGGAGFIGSHLVDALLERTGDSVLVLDNLRRGRLSHLNGHCGNPRFKFLPGDVRDPAFLLEALRDAEVVYHLAGQANVMGALSEPRYTFESNVIGTYNVLDAALQCRVRRVVFASSREAYGEPRRVPVAEDEALAAKNTYGASKVAAEAYCRTYAHVFGLETAILRFASVYGPRDSDRIIPKWIDDALQGRPIEIHGGRQVIDFVWIGVAVDALLRAASADASEFPINVGSGIGTPIGELAARILSVTDSRSRMLVTPDRGAEVRRFIADVSRLRMHLGVVPGDDPLDHLQHLAGAATVRRA
jgi:UDP-glucose 4-epimerase